MAILKYILNPRATGEMSTRLDHAHATTKESVPQKLYATHIASSLNWTSESLAFSTLMDHV